MGLNERLQEEFLGSSEQSETIVSNEKNPSGGALGKIRGGLRNKLASVASVFAMMGIAQSCDLDQGNRANGSVAENIDEIPELTSYVASGNLEWMFISGEFPEGKSYHVTIEVISPDPEDPSKAVTKIFPQGLVGPEHFNINQKFGTPVPKGSVARVQIDGVGTWFEMSLENAEDHPKFPEFPE